MSYKSAYVIYEWYLSISAFFCWLPINAIFARIAMPWPRATKVEEMNIQGRFGLANEFIKKQNLAKLLAPPILVPHRCNFHQNLQTGILHSIILYLASFVLRGLHQLKFAKTVLTNLLIWNNDSFDGFSVGDLEVFQCLIRQASSCPDSYQRSCPHWRSPACRCWLNPIHFDI